MKKPIRVLVVDDNNDINSTLTEAFSASPDFALAGSAHDGLAALNLVATTLPDVIVLDIVIPAIDGLGVLRQLSKTQLAVRPTVFMISSFANDYTQQKALDSGACYFMPKPFHLETLIQEIRSVIYTKRATELLHEIGVPAHLQGYEFLRNAVRLVILDRSYLDGITTQLYPLLASEHNTTSARIERALRHAIKATWDRIDPATFERIYQDSDIRFTDKKKPSNRDFIESIVNLLT